MMPIKNKLHLLPFFLISFLGLFILININLVMAAPKKNDKGKEVSSSEEQEKIITKQNISRYYELFNIFKNCSKEDQSKFIEMLSDPQKLKLLEEKALKSRQTGSSSKKPDDSKK